MIDRRTLLAAAAASPLLYACAFAETPKDTIVMAKRIDDIITAQCSASDGKPNFIRGEASWPGWTVTLGTTGRARGLTRTRPVRRRRGKAARRGPSSSPLVWKTPPARKSRMFGPIVDMMSDATRRD